MHTNNKKITYIQRNVTDMANKIYINHSKSLVCKSEIDDIHIAVYSQYNYTYLLMSTAEILHLTSS